MKKVGKFPKVFLATVLGVMYIPIIIVIIYSFNQSQISAVWGGFSLKWYEQLFRNKSIMNALINSIVLAIASSSCAAVIGTLGAVGMAKRKAKTAAAVEYVSTIPIMIPEIILGVVFMAFFALIGIPFGMTTLIIAHTAFCVPYIFMLVKARLAGMDKSLSEAALDLGASGYRVFFDITLPLIAPAIAAGMLLAFTMSFDDVIISIFVTGAKTTTLPQLIYTQIKTGVTPEINALCTITFLFSVLLCSLSILIGSKKNKSQKT